MGEKVDVLAVLESMAKLEAAVRGSRARVVAEIYDARAAVAELIEAGENVLQDLPRTTTAGPPDMVRRVLRFRAALTNIGGAK